MNTWKSKGVWLCIALLLVVVGILVMRRAQSKPSPFDPRTQLVRRLAVVNDARLAGVLDESTVLVPAGDFVRGSDTGNFNESPQQIVYLDAFEIDCYEVTNTQTSRFLAQQGTRGHHIGLGERTQTVRQIILSLESAGRMRMNTAPGRESVSLPKPSGRRLAVVRTGISTMGESLGSATRQCGLPERASFIKGAGWVAHSLGVCLATVTKYL